jgi:hypothetical protein
MTKQATYKLLIGSKEMELTIEEIKKLYRDMARLFSSMGTKAQKF